MPAQEACRTVTRTTKLRHVPRECVGLASLRDEIRSVEAQIKQVESDCMALIADCMEPISLHLKEAEIDFLEGYLKGLRYTLDRNQ